MLLCGVFATRPRAWLPEKATPPWGCMAAAGATESGAVTLDSNYMIARKTYCGTSWCQMLTNVDDFKRVNRLTDIVPGLKKSGQYHIGPCPFCGGTDRFNVKATEGGDLWVCRQCGDGKYHDVIDFLMRRDGRPFSEIVGNSAAGIRTTILRPTPTPAAVPDLATPPGDDWQTPALIAAAECANFLQKSGDPAAAKAMAYIRDNRHLIDATLQDHMIGFNPAWRTIGDGGRLAPGITIPCMVDGQLWYLNVRTTATARATAVAHGKKLGKYHALTGSKLGALFNADRLIKSRAVFVVEGEFDAMVLSQYTEAVVVTMGSAGSLPSNTWARYFAAARDIMLLLDDDEAGRAALARWQKKIPRARAVQLPDGSKDVSDFRRGRGNLVTWAAAVLRGER